MLLKNDYLTKALWRELEYYRLSPRGLPVVIDQHIYYRRIDNAADCLTLYRFPVEQLSAWNEPGLSQSQLTGEVPKYPGDPDLNSDLNTK